MIRVEVPTLTDDIPPRGCPAPCPILDDVIDLPYSLSVDEPDSGRWVITAEEDEKIARAAKPNLIPRALAGDAEAMADLKRLHVTKWEMRR